jgi:sugar phosphate isomerase/epimerase
MKFCYANRRHALYPDSQPNWDVTAEDYTDKFLGKCQDIGMDGMEIGFQALEGLGSEQKVIDFGKRLADNGVPAMVVRAGGSLTAAKGFRDNRDRLHRLVDTAQAVGADVINGALGAPARYPGKPGSSTGWNVAQDSSRDAMIYDYERLATELQTASDSAADKGITVSVEVHQNTLVDNSWSAHLINDLVDRDNFGINPDLGNVYWTYDTPEETTDEHIKSVAPISVYWHCKNLFRVNHPENERSVFLRVAIPDGEIDYRYAITAMVEADYKGYMAIEGAWAGDQWLADGRSVEYAKSVMADIDAGRG